jgi:glucose uptake protein GlcU
MNFDPTISTYIAIGMGLLAAAMWGSWFITLKYMGDYPLEAFYITLFTTSFILVWVVGFIFDGSALVQNIKVIWKSDPSRIIVTFICGMLYVTGMQFTLRVLKILGLAISQPIQSSINVIGGTAISALIGGVPENLTLTRIITSVIFLLAAVILSMTAGRIRNKAQKDGNIETGLSRDRKEISKAIIMLVIASLLVPAYSTGLSYGLKSITQPSGLAVLPFMAVLVSGATLGAYMICGTTLSVRKQWDVFSKKGFKIHRLGMIAGFAHYGGNIIHTFATRNLSSVVSWPLGITGGLWTQMWGLIFGEFEGSPKSAYFLLGGGMICYIIGAFLIANII